MTAIDHTTTRPIPVDPRWGRRVAQHLAKPGWVIMTLLSLTTIAFVARYLAFNPDSYFPEQREVYIVASSCSVYTCSAAYSHWRSAHFSSSQGCDAGSCDYTGFLARRMSQAARASDCRDWCSRRLLPELGDIVGLRVVGTEHVVRHLDRATHGADSSDR